MLKEKISLLSFTLSLSLFLGLFSVVVLAKGSSASATLKPFKSDGCSHFPDGTIEQDNKWLLCCINHDYSYWQGGTYRQRLQADQALQRCVNDVGEKEVALLMLAGVRVGGTPFLPTKFRWGYGWPYPKFYGPLSAGQQREVLEQKSVSELVKNCVVEKNHRLCTDSFANKAE